MARSMKLFLIRHGETVDNVAQLYAGSRDSALTNHGYQQATRLGLYFKTLGLTFTHLFSSHLQRAAKTAGLIRDAQLQPNGEANHRVSVPEVRQLSILMEQDFGDLEGKKWTDMQSELQNKPGFVAVETKEDMCGRADAFLDEHLLPLLDDTTDGRDPTIAIVSHGIFLSTLWKRLLQRLPAKSTSLSPDLQSTARPSLEHLGGWSNTGYLELQLARDGVAPSPFAADAMQNPMSKPAMSQYVEPTLGDTIGAVEVPPAAVQEAVGEHEKPIASTSDCATACDVKVVGNAPSTPTTPQPSGPRTARGWTTTILTINGKDHLKGLKRTGGGVGSSRHDASQKGIESFFKRRKVG